ncbi:MAG: hypothetical protein ACETVR_02930 [Candidatus Bathyarchaeia archaeon]
MSEFDVSSSSSYLSCLFDGDGRETTEKTGDREILKVFQPFLCRRALVIPSPVWYPHLSLEVRTKNLNFAVNVLNEALFDPYNVEPLLEAKQ